MRTEPADCTRAHPRTSMFVLANMTSSSACGPVKIRNMAPGGALIEGEALPNIGDPLSLGRAGLFVSGQIVWRDSKRAGARFDQEVEVGHWMPAGSSGQQEVDRIVHELKGNAADASSTCRSKIKPSLITDADLLDLATSIDALADQLADDDTVVTRYASRLQVLDTASQILRKLAVGATKGSIITLSSKPDFPNSNDDSGDNSQAGAATSL